METLINLKMRRKINELLDERDNLWQWIIGPLTAVQYSKIMGKTYDEAYTIILDELTATHRKTLVRELIIEHSASRKEIARLDKLLEKHQSISPAMQKFFSE